jgi:uncharacterized protein with PQ loop repeat
MKTYKYIGIVATLLSLSSLLPRYKKIFQTKNISSFDLNGELISYLATLLWFIYHLSISDHISTFTSIIYIVLDTFLIHEIFRQRPQKSKFFIDGHSNSFAAPIDKND